VRQPCGDRGDGEGADDPDADVGRAPPELLSHDGGNGDPDDVGHTEPAEDGRDRRRSSLVGHEGRGDEGADPEEGTMRDPGQETHGEHREVVVRHEDADVRHREEGHEADEQALARNPGCEDRDERCADDDAESVGRDVVPGGRNVHRRACSDLWEQSHRHELRRADGESAERQREDRQQPRSAPGGVVVGRQDAAGCGAHEISSSGFWGAPAGDEAPRPPVNLVVATVIPMTSTIDRITSALRGLARVATKDSRAPRRPGADGGRAPGSTPGLRAPETSPAAYGPYRGDATTLPDTTYAPHPDGEPDPGEIVWGWVPYEEDHTRGKDRPVLVIGHAGDLLVALQLTSRDHDRDEHQERRSGREWVDIGSGAWDRRGRASEVRVNRLLRLDPSLVRREGAVLARDRYEEVVAAVRTHFS
jgi:hypothetical protein